MDAMADARGIDVSHWHPVKDWDRLVADNVHFLGIKATQGAGYRDPTLNAHRDGRRARPELLGAIFYHYPAGGDPKLEARNLLDAIGELRRDEAIALDVEQGPTGLGAPSIEWQRAFIAALPPGHRPAPMIYTATHVWNELGDPPWPDATVGQVDLWIKRYAAAAGPLPSPWSFYRFWQQSESGTVAGVSGSVDINFFNGDAAALAAYFGRT